MILLTELAPVVSDADRWASLSFGHSGKRALHLYRLRGSRLAESMSAELLCRKLLDELCPDELLFPEEDHRGKPFLPGNPFYISLSHSAGYAAAAVSEAPIGIDLQSISRISDSVLKRFYSQEERLWVEAGAAAERSVRLWTMKEAYGKLLGTGIYSGPLFTAAFDHDRLITQYENALFFFPEAPDGILFTLCLGKTGEHDVPIPPL